VLSTAPRYRRIQRLPLLERKARLMMVGSFVRLAAAAAFCALLAGCAGTPSSSYDDAGVTTPDMPLQCVPYARDHSHVALYGDAYTWWNQAAGRFARSASPKAGAVMVLGSYAGPNRAHLAVVREIVDAREIRIDHANWLDDGAIYVNDPVRDVSLDNDWSQVRVYNVKAEAWGSRTYSVQGFIGPDGADPQTLHLAQNPPSATPQTDEIGALIASNQDSEDENN
jgi:surface antigen